MRPAPSLALLLFFAALLPSAAPGAPPEPRTAESAPRFLCLGACEEERMAKAGGGDYRPVDLEPYPIRLHESVDARDSVYIVELFRTVVDHMETVYGPPMATDVFGFAIDTTLTDRAYAGGGRLRMPRISPTIGADGDGDGRVDEDPYDGIDNDGDGAVDEDPDNVPTWDNMFIHELTHLWQGRLLRSRITPSWLIEAFARAAEYLVPLEAERCGCARRLAMQPMDEPMANLDLHDEAGAQVIGGHWSLIDRVDRNLAYRHAAAVLLLPVFAEIREGRADPHPMRRLAEEMERESLRGTPASLWDAIDRAWSAPVDGVLPPSRWVAARSIACLDARKGRFLAVYPTAASGGVDPRRLSVLQFERRHGWSYDYFQEGRTLTYEGPAGRAAAPAPDGDAFVRTPSLPPGAYLVEATASGEEWEGAIGRTWILVTGKGRNAFADWGGAAVVFAGPRGAPYDPPGLRTNGRITARVPGGAIVDLPGGGSLRFTSDDGPVGTVTVPEGFPRFAVIGPGRDPADGVVSWSPYCPAPGEAITVRLRKDRSALRPDNDDVFVKAYWDGIGGEARYPMLPDPAGPDRWIATITAPGDCAWAFLEFGAWASSHAGYMDWLGTITGHGFLLEEEGGAELVDGRVEHGRLVLRFSGWANRSRYRLAAAPSGAGPWTERPDLARPVDAGSTRLAWTLDGGAADSHYRVIERARGKDRVLVALAPAAGTEGGAAAARAPLPNPSRGAVRWTIETPSPMDGEFSVYNAAGRRVHGPERVRIDAGSAEILWDGRTDGGRRAAQGVYLLRIAAPRFDASRKVVLLGRD